VIEYQFNLFVHVSEGKKNAILKVEGHVLLIRWRKGFMKGIRYHDGHRDDHYGRHHDRNNRPMDNTNNIPDNS
jgi:hypothetical protein